MFKRKCRVCGCTDKTACIVGVDAGSAAAPSELTRLGRSHLARQRSDPRPAGSDLHDRQSPRRPAGHAKCNHAVALEHQRADRHGGVMILTEAPTALYIRVPLSPTVHADVKFTGDVQPGHLDLLKSFLDVMKGALIETEES